MSKETKKILVVEDEPDTLTYLATVLEDAGFAVEQAVDGAAALESLKQAAPDLITLDITMPNRTGVRFYRDIKESEQWKQIPVVMVTGVAQEFEKFISSRRQVPPPEGYLSKPVEPDVLIKTIRDLLGTGQEG